MLAFVIRRLGQAVPVIFLSSIGIFLLLHLVPGDPALLIAGQDASPAAVQQVRRALQLDRPLPVQYGVWLGHAVRGDLGTSLVTRLPVAQLIGQRVPATLELAAASYLLMLAIAIPTGVLAAVKQQGPVDWLISSLNGVAIAVPNFWFGILAILLFALHLGWLPPGGRADFAGDPGASLKFLILPALTLAVHPAAGLSRLVKAAMLESLHEDYVRTARAKGMREAAVVVRHALRNALIPVVTVLGLEFGRLLGGAVIVESIFAWPGVGRLILDAVGNRDYTVVQGALLMLVVTFIAVNLATDLVCGMLDPRIRLGAGRGR